MTSQTIKAISVKLRSARQERSMTQEDVAAKAGLSTNYYARIERAEVSPSVETLEKLVKALKVKSSDILSF